MQSSIEKILTIIIPSYNMEYYISKCLDSLLIPELGKLDILVVNDGSKDRTSIIAHEYASSYPDSIRVIDKENGNYGSCINRGLKEARGKYIKILDADDTFDTDSLSKFIKVLEDVDVDCIITDYTKVNPNNETIKEIVYKGIPKNRILSLGDIDVILLKKLAMHAVTYKTSLLHEINYHQSEGVSYTDIEWIFTPVAVSKSFMYISIKLYKYLVGREGQTIDPKISAKHLNDTIIGIKKQILLIEENNNNKNINIVYLKRKLSKRLIRLYTSRLIFSNDNYALIASLDKEYRDKWEEMGIDLNNLSKIPLINKSFIKDWKESNYDEKYSFSKIYKIWFYWGIAMSKINPWYRPSYFSVK